MADQASAAHLPGGSVVVDDLKGKAFYAVGDPGEDDRWVETITERSDPAVDYALRHGAEVVRVGDDTPRTATPIRNEDLTGPERAALDAWTRVSVVAFDYGPDKREIREDVAKHLWVADGGDPQLWDKLADAAWTLGTYNRTTGAGLKLDGGEQREKFLAYADQVLAIAYRDTES